MTDGEFMNVNKYESEYEQYVRVDHYQFQL